MAKNIIDETLSKFKQGLTKFIDQGWTEQNNDGDMDSDQASNFRINEAVSNKVKAVINDFIDAAPLIESAGFRIKDLEIELSVIPKLIPHFEKFSNVDESDRLQIIEQAHDKRLIKLLLKALFKADNFQQSLNMGKLEFSGIEIEITAIPAVRLIYKNPNKMTIDSTDLVE